MIKVCDAVFEGGGVRGIGLVGAVKVLEDAGYSFRHVAGSSAGAIVASLVAAGYTGSELEEELKTVDYNQFKQKPFWEWFPFSKILSLHCGYGLYSGDYIEKWLAELLARKGIATFGDLERKRSEKGIQPLQITAVDILEEKLKVFPRDLKDYGISYASFPIAKAVRMSASIPVFYQPLYLKDRLGTKHYLVDGAVLSNYPMWILDKGNGPPEVPIFGIRFENAETLNHEIGNSFIHYSKHVISTMMDSRDNLYVEHMKGDRQRTIFIPVTFEIGGVKRVISSTDFGISKSESLVLFSNGKKAAEKFLESWNFEQWKENYRQKEKALK